MQRKNLFFKLLCATNEASLTLVGVSRTSPYHPKQGYLDTRNYQCNWMVNIATYNGVLSGTNMGLEKFPLKPFGQI